MTKATPPSLTHIHVGIIGAATLRAAGWLQEEKISREVQDEAKINEMLEREIRRLPPRLDVFVFT